MHVALRADGGPQRGYGHLSRTATLARELRSRGHAVTYLTRTPAATEEVRPSGVEVRELSEDDPGVEPEAEVEPEARAEAVAEQVSALDADALVVDRGELSLEYQRRLNDAITPLALVYDDIGATVCCDLLVNGHVYASPDEYDWVGSEPTWCAGPDYQFFDESLRALADETPPTRESPPTRDPPERAIVLMGGSDPANTTPAAMRAFEGTDLLVEVVVGPGFENREEIAATAESVEASFSLADDPDDLAERLFRADLAVTALGLTAYELAAVGTPYVGIVQAADQRPKAAALADAGAALVVEDEAEFPRAVERLTEEDDLRRRLRRRGEDLVGTDGTARVCDRLEALA